MNTTIIFYGFHVLGFLAVFAYIMIFAPKYGFNFWKASVLTVLSYGSIYIWMLALKRIITGTGGQNMVRAFVFLPLFVLIYSKLLKLDTKKSMDLVAAAPTIVFGVSHIGCCWEGCCATWLRVPWGIWNPIYETKLFPNQICESITALVVSAILIVMIINNKYKGTCNAMPMMLVLYGSTRFLWEFLRNNEKIFWGIGELALWAIGMAIVGGIWLVIAFAKKKKVCIKYD